jgi:diacylglycerol kinase (ATP)
MLPIENVLLVANPISGDLDKEELINEVAQKVEELGKSLTTYLTTGEDDAGKIKDILTNLKPERVLVAGGDGTIVLVAELLRDSPIVLGLLPAGSANGMATDFGIPNDLTIALDIALGESTIRMDGVEINGEISLHLSDLGLNALLVKNYEAGDTRGKLGYAKEVVKTLSEHEIFTVRISTSQNVIETEAVIVIIANAKKYGTGVTINPEGDIADGKFEVVIAKKIDVIELAKLLAGSTEFDPEVVTVLSVTECFIECIDKEAHFQIDGEYKGTVSRLNAKVLPGMVQIAIPGAEQIA